MSRPSALVVPCIGLLAWSALLAQDNPTTVATIGDSFADAIYLAMKARPDLLKKHDIKLVRWSRPIIGLARTDYFDYSGWLSESEPGFERLQRMAEKHQVINVLQSEALQPTGSMVFEVVTSKADYGADNTHFNRNYILKLGDAIFGLSAESKGLLQNRCFSCHKGFDANNVLSPLNRRQGRFVRLKQTNVIAANAAQKIGDGKERSSAPPRPSRVSHRGSAARQSKVASHPAG